MKQIALDEWLGLERRIVPEKFKRWQLWEEALPLVRHYREIKIPKKRGGFRTISIPPEELKKIQKGIRRFLQELWRVWDLSIYGLYRGSYVEHAEFHSRSRFIFSFDLKDAFPSVNIPKLKKILSKKILREEVANTEDEANRLANLVIALTTCNGILPQGAPTSPYLFYVYLLEENLIYHLFRCRPRGLQGWEVSCYVDGVVISSQKLIPPDIQEKIIKTVEGLGFRINEKKIWLRDCRQGAPLITGIRVDGKGRISLSKKKIRRWRGIIHRAAFETDPEKIEKLRQKIEGFVASLRPVYGEKLPHQIEKPYALFKQKREKPA